jgi:membrane protein implicated in regulation of membrane protease activity
MTWLVDLYATHPFWIWLAVGAVFLAAEVSTGTGWLLWPAASSAAMALLVFLLPDSLSAHLAVWAALTIVTTLGARRLFPRNMAGGGGPDINDNIARLVGHQGAVVAAFRNGEGRVFVDGKEWAAVSDEGPAPKLDDKVTVVAAQGSVLRVKPA